MICIFKTVFFDWVNLICFVINMMLAYNLHSNSKCWAKLLHQMITFLYIATCTKLLKLLLTLFTKLSKAIEIWKLNLSCFKNYNLYPLLIKYRISFLLIVRNKDAYLESVYYLSLLIIGV